MDENAAEIVLFSLYGSADTGAVCIAESGRMFKNLVSHKQRVQDRKHETISGTDAFFENLMREGAALLCIKGSPASPTFLEMRDFITEGGYPCLQTTSSLQDEPVKYECFLTDEVITIYAALDLGLFELYFGKRRKAHSDVIGDFYITEKGIPFQIATHIKQYRVKASKSKRHASGAVTYKLPPREELVELFKTYKFKEIADIYGTSRTTVSRWFCYYNIPTGMSRKKMPPKEEIIKTYNVLGWKEGAKKFGVSEQTFRNWAKRIGFYPNKQKDHS